jgi:hypothetical protein
MAAIDLGGDDLADPDARRKNASCGAPQPPGGLGRETEVGMILWVRGKAEHGRVGLLPRPARTHLRSSGVVFECGDEVRKMPVGDAAGLADLDASELARTEQVVDLVAADVEHLRDLLDCVCLQRHHLLGLLGLALAAPFAVTLGSCLRLCLTAAFAPITCRHARET